MPEALHRSVLDVLGMEITAGIQPEGTVLTLERIQQRFAVSRTVARECMRLLEQLQLVTSSRRVGIVVRPSGDWDALDARVIRWRLAGPGRPSQLHSLAELRAAVEPLAAARAARYATVAERAQLRALATRLRAAGAAGDRDECLALDIEFHTVMLRASRNELFAALSDAVAQVLAGRTHIGSEPSEPSLSSLEAHDAVAQAVHDGDAHTAEHAMRAMLTELTMASAERDGH